jgi:thiosulfate/3-mercaptopyruvate sulfurtransferase
MSSPFIDAAELARELGSDTPPAVLDASYILHSPEFDGDYRRETGHPLWLEGHIPGSQYVDVPTQFSDESSPLHYTHPEPQAIADELARIGIGEGRRVVLYDSTATIWAARLWYLLDWIGVDVRVLDGGIAAWRLGGHPVVSGEAAAPEPAATWPVTHPRDAWIDRSELVARSSDDRRPLVCGLPAGSFTGSAPTRYSRRGRIPGSVNVSSRALFASDGTVLAPGDLTAAYESAGVSLDASAPEILLYCGGGISASANALTLAALGSRSVRIYDGSLEEWSADPELPLELG